MTAPSPLTPSQSGTRATPRSRVSVADSGVLLLTRSEVATLLDMDDCIRAVEKALGLHVAGRSLPSGVLAARSQGGGFHIKTAGLALDRLYFAAKTNANFPDNPKRYGQPTIQGIILLADGERGTPLALLDSIEITMKRTGAATAIAAKHLARKDAKTVAICGCGAQGHVQLEALAKVRRLSHAYAYDADRGQAARLAAAQSKKLGIAIEPVQDFRAAVRNSDIVVTCTTSRSPILERAWVAPGTFVAAVGADSADRQEVEPALLAAGLLVVDDLEQCASIGELHHAIAAGVASRDDVHAQLAELVAGTKPGRRNSEEITIFDSTGTALEDVAAAIVVYNKAARDGRGRRLDFAR